MGIPKFFRWISERYPCLNELVSEHQIPEFDNLYLDMNGIIHVCSHPNDFDPHFRISEEKIFKAIFTYLETLFYIIKPQKLFFMAVDGVAPRAKMNQQRGRRFRSAKEAELLEETARKRGEHLPSERRFDSNCITPGTEFMVKLQSQLKYFVAYKVTNDKLWQRPRIILSGHETPGEGEHKIMDYIRYLKSSPTYNPITRHCLYGLDADLIMLGLCTHETYFSLLREEVKFGKKQKRMSSPAETKFYLLHLSLMREYLDLEFSAIKETLTFPYDIDCIINDWVLMCFLVGNDFIPNLPGLHISTGALPILHKAYMDVLPKLDGYINEYGYLNLERFHMYMDRLSVYDREQFKDAFADLKYFASKCNRHPVQNKRTVLKYSDEEHYSIEIKCGNKQDLAALIQSTDAILLESSEDDDLAELFNLGEIEDLEDSDELVRLEFLQHKMDYYRNKLNFSTVTPEILRCQAEGYVRAIQWNLHYYYHGVCSWSWFYPHHYAPFISDIRNFTGLDLNFEVGEPFLPFQQLLAVLPSASKDLLPAAYRELMEEHTSPIRHYYPKDFTTDLNGKRQEWEALVLIPFIDQKELLDAMSTCESKLTVAEIARNKHGPMLQYDYHPTSLGTFEGTEFFPRIKGLRALITPVDRKSIEVPRSKLVKGLCPGYNPVLFIPGFPTLRHIPHVASLNMCKVRVFERPSQQETLMLRLMNEANSDLSLAQVADKLLGKTVYVSYPHLIEARVVGVCNKRMKFEENSNNEVGCNYKMQEFKNPLTNPFILERKTISENYRSRLGIDVGDTTTVLYAHVLVGRKYAYTPQGKVTLEKQWNVMPTSFALQTIVEELLTPATNYTQYSSIAEVFTPSSRCFIIGHPFYGSPCKVIACDKVKLNCVHVEVEETLDPCFTNIQKSETANLYNPSSVAAQFVGISSYLFSTITGAIFITSAQSPDAKKINIGLNLKFNSRKEEVPGYTQKSDGVWLYSHKTITLVGAYLTRFPNLFHHLGGKITRGNWQEEELFPANGEEKLSDVLEWLKEQPYANLDHRKCGAANLEQDIVLQIEKILINWEKPTPKTSKIQVTANCLYKPDITLGNIEPDPAAIYSLYDRIYNVTEGIPVPFGLKGTVIGIEPVDDIIEVIFDEEFEGGMLLKCNTSRGYRMCRSSLINTSHGRRAEKDLASRRSAFVSCKKVGDSSALSSPGKVSSTGHAAWKESSIPEIIGFQTMWNNLIQIQSDPLKPSPTKVLREDLFAVAALNKQREMWWFNLKEWAKMDDSFWLTILINLQDEFPKTKDVTRRNLQLCEEDLLTDTLNNEKEKEKDWISLEENLKLQYPIIYKRFESIKAVTLRCDSTREETKQREKISKNYVLNTQSTEMLGVNPRLTNFSELEQGLRKILGVSTCCDKSEELPPTQKINMQASGEIPTSQTNMQASGGAPTVEVQNELSQSVKRFFEEAQFVASFQKPVVSTANRGQTQEIHENIGDQHAQCHISVNKTHGNTSIKNTKIGNEQKAMPTRTTPPPTHLPPPPQQWFQESSVVATSNQMAWNSFEGPTFLPWKCLPYSTCMVTTQQCKVLNCTVPAKSPIKIPQFVPHAVFKQSKVKEQGGQLSKPSSTHMIAQAPKPHDVPAPDVLQESTVLIETSVMKEAPQVLENQACKVECNAVVVQESSPPVTTSEPPKRRNRLAIKFSIPMDDFP